MKKILIIGMFVILFTLVYLDESNAQATGVCCLEEQGFCSSSLQSSVCTSSGGEVLGPGSCFDSNRNSQYAECSILGCVFSDGKCQFGLNAGRCEYLGGEVRASITSEAQCEAMNENTAGGGVSLPGEQQPETSLPTQEERVFASCEVNAKTKVPKITIDGVPYTEETKITREMLGSRDGQIVRERKHGESWCVIYATDDGKNWGLYPKAAFEIGDSHNPLLEGKNNLWTDNHNALRRGFSAGQRHAVYSCVDGELVVEQGDQFRAIEGVCLQNDEPQFYLAFPESVDLMEREFQKRNGPVSFAQSANKYATCEHSSGFSTIDGSRLVNTVVDYMKQTQTANIIGSGRNSLLLRTGSAQNPLDLARQNYHNGFSNAILVDNYQAINHCERARYPVGSQFYPDNIVFENAPPSECGECGGGFWDTNRCDKGECHRQGDCSYSGGLNPLAGCAAGAAASLIIWNTAGAVLGGPESSVGVTQTPLGTSVPSTGLGISSGSGGIGITGTGTALLGEGGLTAGSTFAGVTTPTTFAGIPVVPGFGEGLFITQGGASMATKALTYTAAAESGQRVVARFVNPRNARRNPTFDSEIVGTSVEHEITGIEQRGENIWAQTADGNYVLLNSPTGTNEAYMYYSD